VLRKATVDPVIGERRRIARLLPERRLIVDVLPVFARQVVVFSDAPVDGARKPLLRLGVAFGVERHDIP
jgi:hypothetical protein